MNWKEILKFNKYEIIGMVALLTVSYVSIFGFICSIGNGSPYIDDKLARLIFCRITWLGLAGMPLALTLFLPVIQFGGLLTTSETFSGLLILLILDIVYVTLIVKLVSAIFRKFSNTSRLKLTLIITIFVLITIGLMWLILNLLPKILNTLFPRMAYILQNIFLWSLTLGILIIMLFAFKWLK